MSKNPTDTKQITPASQQEWRQWLQQNHERERAVWVVFHKKASDGPTISWSDAVDEALCFGWIDSTRRPIDADQFKQYFSRRKPNGTWSAINKEKVQRLAEAGLMAPAGLASIETARQNGSWTMLDSVEQLIVPEDMKAALEQQPGAKDLFMRLSKSDQKLALMWLILAKRPETRQKRIKEMMQRMAKGLKPKEY